MTDERGTMKRSGSSSLIIHRSSFTVVLVLLLATNAFAWGEKGHYMAGEAATYGTPVELPPFFHAAYERLIFLGYDPDRLRNAGSSADAVNGPDHFLDYEYVAHLQLPADRYEYLQLLNSSGTLRRFGISNDTAGFVVWRIAETTQYLERAWRLWRRAATPAERAEIEQTIIFFAGTLGHFVSDSANPHHASINHNGWVQPNPNRYPYDCETHGRFESQFVTGAVELSDVLPKLRQPVRHDDYFVAALDLIRNSHSLIEELYRLDRDGAFAWPRGTAAGKAFASDRLAVGASTLRDLWWSAWVNSGRDRSRN